MKKKITYLPAFPVTGCSYYRMDLPMHHLRMKYGDEFEISRLGLGEMAKLKTRKAALRLLRSADAVVVQMSKSVDLLMIATELKQSGTKIVYELDDNYWEICPSNPAYGGWGTEETGKWRNGREEFFLHKNRDALATLRSFIDMADMVTMPSNGLKEYVAGFTNKDKIQVLPNYVDNDVWDVVERPLENRMVFPGGRSHLRDIKEIEDAICACVNEDGLEFIAFGVDARGSLPKIKAGKCGFVDSVFITDYPETLCELRPQFTIAPLRDTLFNRCKSYIKVLECASLGVPVVYSNVEPFSELERRMGFPVDNDIEKWKEMIRIVCGDAELVQAQSKADRELVRKEYSIQANIYKWRDAYRGLLS